VREPCLPALGWDRHCEGRPTARLGSPESAPRLQDATRGRTAGLASDDIVVRGDR
jgi:hypothetical protein